MFRRSIFNVSLDTFLCNLRRKSHSGSRQQGFACIMCYSSKAEPALLIEVRWRIRWDKAHISTLSDCSWQFKSPEKYMVRIKTFLPVWKPNKHFSVFFFPLLFKFLFTYLYSHGDCLQLDSSIEVYTCHTGFPLHLLGSGKSPETTDKESENCWDW